MPMVLIGLGSNQNREANIQSALDFFRSEFDNVQVSEIIETEALNGKSEHYLNTLVAFPTELDPFELRYKLKVLEIKCGRNKLNKGVIALDADVLLYGDETIDHPLLKIPSDDFDKFEHIHKLLQSIQF